MEKAYIVIYSAAQISEVQETVLKQNEVVHNVITDNEYQNKMEITFVILMGYWDRLSGIIYPIRWKYQEEWSEWVGWKGYVSLITDHLGRAGLHEASFVME